MKEYLWGKLKHVCGKARVKEVMCTHRKKAGRSAHGKEVLADVLEEEARRKNISKAIQ